MPPSSSTVLDVGGGVRGRLHQEQPGGVGVVGGGAGALAGAPWVRLGVGPGPGLGPLGLAQLLDQEALVSALHD